MVFKNNLIVNKIQADVEKGAGMELKSGLHAFLKELFGLFDRDSCVKCSHSISTDLCVVTVCE